MTKASRGIFEQVFRLSRIERAAFVEEIHRSLGGAEDTNLTQAWPQEAEERIDAHDRGQLSGRDYQQVKESLQRR